MERLLLAAVRGRGGRNVIVIARVQSSGASLGVFVSGGGEGVIMLILLLFVGIHSVARKDDLTYIHHTRGDRKQFKGAIISVLP